MINLEEVKFPVRVKLSDKGKRGTWKPNKDRKGTALKLYTGKYGKDCVWVLWDGIAIPRTYHISFIEKDEIIQPIDVRFH